MRPEPDNRLEAICRTCGGPIFRRTWPSSTEPRGGWLHIHPSDWIDHIHPPVPEDPWP